MTLRFRAPLSVLLVVALCLAPFTTPPGRSGADAPRASIISAAPATDAVAARNLSFAPRRPMAGERTTFRGRLKPRGKPVRLEVRRAGRWQVVDRGRVGRHSTYRLRARVMRTATYRVRARGYTSPRMRVRVIGQSVSHSAVTPLVVGLPRAVRVRPAPVRANRAVALQVRGGGTWNDVAVGRTNSSGVATLTRTGTTVGTHTYRVVARSFHRSRSAASPAFALRTARPTEVASRGSTIGAESYDADISADGRWVSFTSEARLRPTDTDDLNDVYLFDRVTGGLTHLLPGADGHVNGARLSADGRYVGFQTLASNLVSGDTGRYDVFVLDRRTGAVDLVSRTVGGTPGNGNSFIESMSDDGRFVAYASFASDLVAFLPPANTTYRHGYLHDRADDGNTGLDRVGLGWATDNIYGIDISGDGSRLAFRGSADLDPGNVDGSAIFAWDIDADGTVGNRTTMTPGLLSGNPHLDHDGDVLALTIWEDAVATDVDGEEDAYVLTGGPVGGGGVLQLARPGGTGPSEASGISATGRWVTIESAVNAGFDDTNGAVRDVIVFDRIANERVVVSRGGAGASGSGVISADGSVVAYGSASDGLAPGSDGSYDVFAAVLR